MRRQGDIQEKRDGYGRIPNTLIKSGAWALFDRRMMAIFVALVGLLDRTMKYTDGEGTWRVSYGHPTLEQIANASRVRRADISRITDLFQEIDLISKKPEAINRKRRVRYILPPPEHPMSSRIGDSCARIYQQTAKNWGLRREYRPLKKSHESPDRRLSHESPVRRPSTDIHRPKSSPTPSKTLRRPIPSRAAARLSHKSTTKGKVSDRLLAPLFASLPPETWEDHTVSLLADDHRLRDIEEAKRIASDVRPYLPTFNRERGKGGPAGETVGVPPGRKDSSSRLPEKERRLCHGTTRTHLACVLRPIPESRFCRCHQAQAERA